MKECSNQTCKADLTKPSSVVRRYDDKDDADNTIESEGHYVDGDHFESDDNISLSGGRFDLADDSDTCASCGAQL
jgi:hypothetical protein